MKKKVTAIFDIGKTNKKFFLFDSFFREVHREYIHFDEIEDEDGHPTENLSAVERWMKEVFDKVLKAEEFDITALNFTSYGASLVHLDGRGQVLTPLYNYTKPLDQELTIEFYKKHGPESELSRKTGCSNSGMLNSGMQLYWLKYRQPEVFQKIKYSLHLPQYLSYIFTGIPVSEYTSIGCHTSLWDFDKNDYHDWVYKESINRILPQIVSTNTSINMNYLGKQIKIGVGIHDSSSALVPYVKSVTRPFILVSTGTWSISLNPFADASLAEMDIKADCINYMRIDGKPVKSSRIFLGNIYRRNIEKLTRFYNKPKGFHHNIVFNIDAFTKISQDFKPYFIFKRSNDEMVSTTKDFDSLPFSSFEIAYHHFMVELIQFQIESIGIARGNSNIEQLFVDGGFSENNVYIQLLTYYLKNMKVKTTTASLGSALGAAVVITNVRLNSKFLKENYSLHEHFPFINS